MTIDAVSRYLSDFIAKYISIDRSIRSRAATSQKALRDFLSTENSRDPHFPVVMSTYDSDFIGGSFARHTKIWPLDDIDIYFPLDGYNLYWINGGARTSVQVLTDGKIWSNPLINTEWMVGTYISSSKLSSAFAQVLRRRYPNTEIEAADESVSVQTTIGACGSSDGLNFDAVPCFAMTVPSLSYRIYGIPDGSDGWIWTNPRVDEQVCSELHAYHNGLYRPTVKLLKYWALNKFADRLGSYYVELACSKKFLEMKNSEQVPSSLSAAAFIAFAHLLMAVRTGDQISFVLNSPPVKTRKAILPDHIVALVGAADKARKAWEFEVAGDAYSAVAAWKSLIE